MDLTTSLANGDVEKWIGTLDAAKKLGARTLCPGHGPRALSDLVDDQQIFFKQVREKVGELVQAKKSSAGNLSVGSTNR